MADSTKDTPGVPENAFAADFQDFLQEEGSGTAEKKKAEDWLVPWSIEEGDGEWSVFRPGESSANGDQPVVHFPKKRTAELWANVLLPVTQREPKFSLGLEAGDQGFPIYQKGKDEPIGHIQDPPPDFIMRFNIAEALSTSPSAMGWVLADGGASLVEQVGEASFLNSLLLEKEKEEFEKE